MGVFRGIRNSTRHVNHELIFTVRPDCESGIYESPRKYPRNNHIPKMKIKQIRTGRKIQVESKRANGHTVRFGGSKVQIRFCAFVVPWKRDKSAKNKSYYPYHHYKFRFKIVYVRSIFYFFVRQISDYIFGEFH